MSAMDPKRLAEIRARVGAATDPPWRACVWDPMERPHVHKDSQDETACRVGADLPLTKADAEFIGHARTDVPDLLAEVERLQAELDEAWRAADTPVRGMVSLAEVIQGRRDAYLEMKGRADLFEKTLTEVERALDPARALGAAHHPPR